jgi:hypothetical protein
MHQFESDPQIGTEKRIPIEKYLIVKFSAENLPNCEIPVHYCF